MRTGTIGMIAATWMSFVAGFAPLEAAIIYDAQSDFSVSNGNPNGVWSYGVTGTLHTPSSFATYGLNSSPPRWGGFDSLGTSVIGKSDDPVFDAPAGTLYMHPGVAGGSLEFATLRFTAPTTSIYNVFGHWWMGDPNGGPANGFVNIYIDINGTPFYFGAPTNIEEITSFIVSLNAGDKVDFIVGAAGDYSYDTTPMNMVLTDLENNPSAAVPEPVSIVLWGFGTMACIAGSYRRRK